ncbi:MAG: NIPSNAP family protein [Bryobacteraceae bacterium]
MHRRSFIGALGGLGALAAPARPAEEKRTRFYLLEQFFLKNGPQVGREHEFMEKFLLPALSAVHSGPKIYLEAMVAPQMPQLAAIYGFESLDHLWNTHLKMMENAELMKKSAEFESDPEAVLEQQTNTLLEATAFSPEIVPLDSPPASPRLFELRVYHSPTWRQLAALHERFAGPEIKIFHRCGIHPVLYGSTVFGANMPNLTYLIPFVSLAEREKAWSAFSAEPEWIKVRKESIDRHGQIASLINVSLYRATSYSPVR